MYECGWLKPCQRQTQNEGEGADAADMGFPWDSEGDNASRRRMDSQAHLQPKVTPRAVGRSNFGRLASGISVGFIGELHEPHSQRDKLRQPDSARLNGRLDRDRVETEIQDDSRSCCA